MGGGGGGIGKRLEVDFSGLVLVKELEELWAAFLQFAPEYAHELFVRDVPRMVRIRFSKLTKQRWGIFISQMDSPGLPEAV